MGFLDPKPQTAAGLDTAVKNAITTPGTETATALNATYASLSDMILNARNYGAVADMATDVIAPINAALAALPGTGGVVYLPPGNYLANNAQPVNLKANQSLRGEPGQTRIVRRNSGAYGTIRSHLSNAAAQTTIASLTANAAKGARTLTVDTTANIAAGQFLQIYSTAKFAPGSNNNQGEIVTVAAVTSATALTIRNGLRDAYSVANAAGLRNPGLQRDITIHGLIMESEDPLTATSAPLIHMQNCRNLRISDVSCRNHGGPAVTLDTCVGFTVSNYDCSNLQDDDTTGKFGYGINASNSSEDGVINGVTADYVRHAFTTTGSGGGIAGVPRNITVANGVARNCSTTAAWDTHTDGENIKFVNVSAYDSAIGIQIRSRNTEAVNPSIDRCGIGLLVTGGGSGFRMHGGVLSNTYARTAPVSDMGNAIVLRGGSVAEGVISDITLTNVFIDGYEGAPLKIHSGAGGGTPTNIKTPGLRTSSTPQAPSLGRGIRSGAGLYYGAAGALANDVPIADRLILAPVDVDRVCAISELSASINTAGTAGAVTRLGLYKDDGSGVWPGALVVDAGTIDGTVVGAASKTFTAITLMPGRYWVGAVNQGAPTTGAQLRSITTTGGAVLMPSPTADPANYNTGALQIGITGALPATFTTTYNVAFNSPRVLMRLT